VVILQGERSEDAIRQVSLELCMQFLDHGGTLRPLLIQALSHRLASSTHRSPRISGT
jgi:hypothetical protein